MCPPPFLNAHSPCKSYLSISKTNPKSKIPPKPTALSVLYCQGPECHRSTSDLCNYYIYYVDKVYYLLSVSSTIPGRPYLPKAPPGTGALRCTSVMMSGSVRLSVQLTHCGAQFSPFECKQVSTHMLSAPFLISSILPLATTFKP